MSTAPVRVDVPGKPHSFLGWLDTFKTGIAKVFHFAEKVAAKEEPLVDAFLTMSGNAEVATLFNSTLSLTQMAEAAAAQAGADKAGPQKAAAVIMGIMPQVSALEQKFGVKVDAQKWNDAVVLAAQAITVAVTPAAP